MRGLLTLQGGTKMKHPVRLSEFLSANLLTRSIGYLLKNFLLSLTSTTLPLIGWERLDNERRQRQGGWVCKRGDNESRKAPPL